MGRNPDSLVRTSNQTTGTLKSSPTPTQDQRQAQGPCTPEAMSAVERATPGGLNPSDLLSV